MIDKLIIPGVRLGRCVAVSGVGYMSGPVEAVRAGLRRFQLEFGGLEILAEQQVEDELSVQFRCPEPLEGDRVDA